MSQYLLAMQISSRLDAPLSSQIDLRHNWIQTRNVKGMSRDHRKLDAFNLAAGPGWPTQDMDSRIADELALYGGRVAAALAALRKAIR